MGCFFSESYGSPDQTNKTRSIRFYILKWRLHAHVISECIEDDSSLVNYRNASMHHIWEYCGGKGGFLK